MVRPVIRVPFAEVEVGQAAGPGPYEVVRSGSAGQKQFLSKVPSLMFDLEDAEDASPPTDSLAAMASEADVVNRIKAALEPCNEAEYMLALHVRIASDEAAKRGAPHLAVTELADTLRRLGYAVKLRTALGGGWGGACLRNLRHSFLAVTLPGTSGVNDDTDGGAAILVDPRFKEQFEIAHATPRYARLLEAVPVEAVGPPDRIAFVVELLCSEIAVAFAETGTPLPPWRQTAAMLTKWQPRRSEDVELSRGGFSAVDAAAVLNNAAGRATGRSTVAERLAMLGVMPGPASPISEGLEDIESWSTGTDDAQLSPNDNHAFVLSMTPEVDKTDVTTVEVGGASSAGNMQSTRRNTWG